MPSSTLYRATLPNGTSGDVTWTECEGNEVTVFVPSKIGSIIFSAQTDEYTVPGGSVVETFGTATSDCLSASITFTTTTTTSAPPEPPAPTTTTLAPSSFSLGYHASSAANSCYDYTSSPTTYYSFGGTVLQNTLQIFTNSGLTIPAPNGYYSDGTNYFIISDNGTLDDKGTCLSVTTTTTTTTTTTAAPIQSWFAERNDGNATAYVGPYSTWSGTFGVGSSVVVNDGSGICWTLMSESTAGIQFNITGVCPPPTTTTTAAPTTTTTTIGRTTTTTTGGPIE